MMKDVGVTQVQVAGVETDLKSEDAKAVKSSHLIASTRLHSCDENVMEPQQSPADTEARLLLLVHKQLPATRS